MAQSKKGSVEVVTEVTDEAVAPKPRKRSTKTTAVKKAAPKRKTKQVSILDRIVAGLQVAGQFIVDMAVVVGINVRFAVVVAGQFIGNYFVIAIQFVGYYIVLAVKAVGRFFYVIGGYVRRGIANALRFLADVIDY